MANLEAYWGIFLPPEHDAATVTSCLLKGSGGQTQAVRATISVFCLYGDENRTKEETRVQALFSWKSYTWHPFTSDLLHLLPA